MSKEDGFEKIVGHDAEETLLRLRIIGSGAAQGLDEADQAGQE